MNPISRIAPVTDAEAAALASSATLADLAGQITAIPPAATAAAGPAQPGRLRRPGTARRRLLIGVPVAAGLAVLGLVATSLGAPGQHVGPVGVGPAPAQAAPLSITRHGGDLKVIVRNPLVDPARFRAEFARYHLNITLRLVPASPSIVGSVVYDSYSGGGPHGIQLITATGKCFTGGGGDVCPVGFLVPVDYRGTASLVFARAARPGERYESSGQVTSPGEAMHGLHYAGKTVSQVLAMLGRRGVTVAQWRAQRGASCYTGSPRTVPGSWYVTSADPWAPGQVLLSASRTWPPAACRPAPGTPVPSPTASAAG
jgi:hypothetical protein